MIPRSVSRCVASVTFAILWWPATARAAEVVDIDWNPAGRFERSLAVHAGGFVEVCGKLAKGQKVRWEFAADRSLAFNIHYHVGKDVTYPERRDAVQRLDGELVAPVDQDYCWMWSNASGGDVRVNVSLQR